MWSFSRRSSISQIYTPNVFPNLITNYRKRLMAVIFTWGVFNNREHTFLIPSLPFQMGGAFQHNNNNTNFNFYSASHLWWQISERFTTKILRLHVMILYSVWFYVFLFSYRYGLFFSYPSSCMLFVIPLHVCIRHAPVWCHTFRQPLVTEFLCISS